MREIVLDDHANAHTQLDSYDFGGLHRGLDNALTDLNLKADEQVSNL